MNSILSNNGYSRSEKLSWGADELMLSAFARQLPERTISVNIQNPSARFFYDSGASASELVEEAAKKAGLRLVGNGSDINVVAFTLTPEANESGAQTFPTGIAYANQRKADQAFALQLHRLPKDILSRTVVIDARLNNGAMDTTSLPPTTDVLGYSAWGTGGNNFGQSLAMAKIITDAQDRAKKAGDSKQLSYLNTARRQLVVESVAHDAFFIGYANGASALTLKSGMTNPLASELKSQKLPAAPGEKLGESSLKSLSDKASRYATANVQKKYPGLSGRIQFIPQPFNRRFEASTLYSGGVIRKAGSISLELVRKYPQFNPANTYRGYVPDRTTGDKGVGSNGAF
jgi:hypothetical protein